MDAEARAVLGIDPGSRVTGWGLVAGSSHRPRFLEGGAIRLDPGIPFAERLAVLHREIRSLVARLQPRYAAVEAPFHGASPRSALQLAHARGVVLAALAADELQVAEYAPAEVKKAVTGNGRAPKDQVARMVGVLLPAAPAAGPADRTDALAVALCHLSSLRHPAAGRAAGIRDWRRFRPVEPRR